MVLRRHGVPKARLEVLRQVSMFEGLPTKALARIDSHCDEVTVHKGRTLTTEGDRAQEAFIVAEGRAEVTIGDEVVGESGPGDMIGEIGVIKHVPRTATVRALTDMRLLVVDGRDLQWLFEDRKLAERVNENLERHLAGGGQGNGPA